MSRSLQEVDETAGGVGAVYFEEVRFHRDVMAAHAYGSFLAHLTAWAEANKIVCGWGCRSVPSSATRPGMAMPTSRP
jgi:hypothetical protein